MSTSCQRISRGSTPAPSSLRSTTPPQTTPGPAVQNRAHIHPLVGSSSAGEQLACHTKGCCVQKSRLTSQSTAKTDSAIKRRLSQTSASPCTALVMMKGMTNFAIRPASKEGQGMLHRATEGARHREHLGKQASAEVRGAATCGMETCWCSEHSATPFSCL